MRELNKNEIQQIGGGAQAWLDPLMHTFKQARRAAGSAISGARARQDAAHHSGYSSSSPKRHLKR